MQLSTRNAVEPTFLENALKAGFIYAIIKFIIIVCGNKEQLLFIIEIFPLNLYNMSLYIDKKLYKKIVLLIHPDKAETLENKISSDLMASINAQYDANNKAYPFYYDFQTKEMEYFLKFKLSRNTQEKNIITKENLKFLEQIYNPIFYKTSHALDYDSLLILSDIVANSEMLFSNKEEEQLIKSIDIIQNPTTYTDDEMTDALFCLQSISDECSL